MAPAGSDDARNRSTSTCDWRHSAKSSTAAISASRTGRSSSAGPSAAAAGAGVREVSCRHSDGSCTATIRQPPTATPAAAARTPTRRRRRTSWR